MASVLDDVQRAAEIAETLKAVGHPLRLRIIALLVDGPEHVNAMAERLDATQPSISQQLRILRMHGLVAVSRENGHAWYRVDTPNLEDLVHCMERCAVPRGGVR